MIVAGADRTAVRSARRPAAMAVGAGAGAPAAGDYAREVRQHVGVVDRLATFMPRAPIEIL